MCGTKGRSTFSVNSDGRRQQRAAGGGQDRREQCAEEQHLHPQRHLAQHQVGQDALDDARASSPAKSLAISPSATSAA
jgi:hypothetical protein